MNRRSGRSGSAAFLAWFYKVTKKRLCHITRRRHVVVASHHFPLHQHIPPSHPKLDDSRHGEGVVCRRKSLPSGAGAGAGALWSWIWSRSLRVITRSSLKSDISIYLTTTTFLEDFCVFINKVLANRLQTVASSGLLGWHSLAASGCCFREFRRTPSMKWSTQIYFKIWIKKKKNAQGGWVGMTVWGNESGDIWPFP